MRNRIYLALLLLCGLAPAAAQSVLTLAPKDCLYRPGDDPSWAAPSLDETLWRPYYEWRADISHPRLWVRCSLNLSSLSSVTQTQIQIRFYGPYEAYLDGQRFAAAGNLDTGDFSLNVIRSYPVAAAHDKQIIALRLFDRSTLYNAGTLRTIMRLPLQLRVGDPSLLNALHSDEVLAGARRQAVTFVCYGIIGILSIPLFVLYFFDRSRTAVLLLALDILFLSILRCNEFAVATFAGFSVTTAITIATFSLPVAMFAGYPFYFVLAGRRMPAFMWITLALGSLNFLPLIFDIFAVRDMPSIAWLNNSVLDPAIFFALLLLTASPYVAFLPWSRIAPRMRPIAVLCMAWTGADFLWFLLEITTIPIPGIPNLYAHWGLTLLYTRGIITALAVSTLFALLFREQRFVALDRATLAGELQAAASIQRMLAPPSVPAAPGFEICVAFLPMREVGGDFYLCRILPEGRQRVLLGDVSGKGTAAAMTATLLLGAASARDADSPAALLAHLNRVFLENCLSGFATCLCADFDPSGEVVLANAGHLAPYLAGLELSIPSSLPLGLAPITEMEQLILNIQPGKPFVFVSDGVVEARNTTGELLGFDRTAALSVQTANQIANAAKLFGQEDDITVLTILRN